jgi:spermidine synthase
MAEKRWIPETLFDDLGFRMTFEVDKVLYELHTEHQHLILFEQQYFGKMLMLDGATQISKRDEFIYQEMMSHVPLFAHGNAQEVLIIGGGDCGIAEEVLKHKTVKRLTQVEIDAKVVEFAKEHFPEFTGPVFADKRFESVIDDGAKYVAKTDRRFDAIIVDSTDPIGVGEVLFTDQFYANCARILTARGLVVNQCGVPFMQADELRETSARRAKFFPHITAYVAAVPTYVGGFMTLGWAAKDASLAHVDVDAIRARAEAAGILGGTHYWTPEIHVGAFNLPPYIAEHLPK